MRNLCSLLILLLLIIEYGCYAQSSQSTVIVKGRIEKFQFHDSKIFPGTQRDVTVYIPSEMDSSKPSCVYVQQDGFDKNQGLNNIFDTLIFNHEMPVTVGIFITSGFLQPSNSNTLGRPNRCYEYDGVGDRYARFVLEEIIPLVESKYKLHLSHNANDCCIGGCSSGGISAFNTAWERPDAFSRVYCISGSFVAFRAGHEFPTLIRKTEAKAIRAYLVTGTHDMENCAGDWTLLDMEMDKALKFSGYEYKFSVKEGYHCSAWKESFAEGMRYLWKGWPDPVKVGPSAPRVQDILVANQTWQLVASGFIDARGPACNAKGEVFFTDPGQNKIYSIGLQGNIKLFLADARHGNAISFDASGQMYVVSSITGKIMGYDSTAKGTLYSDGIKGNYVLAKPDGGLYVISSSLTGQTSKIWLVNKDNKTVVDTGLKNATGIALSPNQWLLAVGDNHSHFIYSYQITPNGNLLNKERFFWLHVQDWFDDSGVESICYDREGHLYAATRYGIQVCAWDGPTQVILPLPKERVIGLCLGGINGDILFAFCGDKIYKRKIKNHVLNAFTPWTKMTSGRL